MNGSRTVFGRVLLVLALNAMCSPAGSQTVPGATGGLQPNLLGHMDRSLRYRPDNGDFVIENGEESYNRPLYGGDTAFRVDGGDKPEFVLYLPGRGGNLRLGITSAHEAKWLQQMAQVQTRYRPGELLYEIRDPILGEGALTVEVAAYSETEGLIVRISARDIPRRLQLFWAYGGISGERGARDGDIGTERVPISRWFQFKPEFASGNTVKVSKRNFEIDSPHAKMVCVSTAPAKYARADASAWENPAQLLKSADFVGMPAVGLARVPLVADVPIYISLQRMASVPVLAEELDVYKETRAATHGKPAARPLLAAFSPADLPRLFAEVTARFAALRKRIAIDTPDPYINAAAASLNVAAEATWDGAERAVMHGAVAWRAKLLGWRGPYWLDALGESDRADEHFRSWAKGQNTSPIPASLPPPETASNLARAETALHSNGDLSNSHYDMNTVYIDALFRHLEWTGDLKLARELWPVIVRHLAWERRLFRRTFGAENLPLYEAYAVIWASDDLYYSGGGATHSSAYQYFHNRMAAKLAALIGEDPSAYQAEADAIRKGMQAFLWMPDAGAFGEYRDLLGEQRLHPSFALWTYYHTIDSEVVSPQNAWLMSAAMQKSLPWIPVAGPGVPTDRAYGMHSTTNWMPYSWSINNVVTQENLHAALALWQSRLNEDAFTLAKSALLASMFMGISPGNLGTLAYPDVYRRESQRDFADSAGVTARAFVEGLFGINPAGLSRTLFIRPGFPAAWSHASISHPLIDYEFTRSGQSERWRLHSTAKQFATLVLEVNALRDVVGEVTVNGERAEWSIVEDAVGQPRIRVSAPGGGTSLIAIEWRGDPIPAPPLESSPVDFVPISRGNLSWLSPKASQVMPPHVATTLAARQNPKGRMEPVNMASRFNDQVTNLFATGKYLSPRSPYVSLALPSQGIGAWAGHVQQMARIDDRGLSELASRNGGQIVTPDGIPFLTATQNEANNILFTSLWANYSPEATIALTGRAANVHLLMAGTTNFMQSRFENGEVVVTYADGTVEKLPLRNPENWWPIEQDYFIDDYQFRIEGPLPTRVDLATGIIRKLDLESFKGRGREVPGGAATVLSLKLDAAKTLRKLTVRTTANDVVIGLMAITLERP
jgi:hypothetical protein